MGIFDIKVVKLSKKRVRKFTCNKVKNGFNIDGSLIDPMKVGTLSKGFEERYYEYLENLVFGNIGDEVNFEKFVPIIILAEAVHFETLPMQIISSKGPKLRRRTVDVLEKFFNDYGDELVALYKMYTGSVGKETKEVYRELLEE